MIEISKDFITLRRGKLILNNEDFEIAKKELPNRPEKFDIMVLRLNDLLLYTMNKHLSDSIVENLYFDKICDLVKLIENNTNHFQETFSFYGYIPETYDSHTLLEGVYMKSYNDMSSKVNGYIKSSSPKEIDLITEDEFLEISQNIMKSTNSVGNTELNELSWFLNNYPNLVIPKIGFKEIKCVVMKYRDYYEGVTSVNDIVRFAYYSMNLSPSLFSVEKMITINSWRRTERLKNPQWRKASLKRKDRKRVLNFLENYLTTNTNAKDIITDAMKQYGAWLLVSERLHPGEYKKTHPKSVRFFEAIKDKDVRKNFRTWNYGLQEMYDNKAAILDIAKYLSVRPGEFARRFDSLIRNPRISGSEELQQILDLFLDVKGISSKVLLEMIDHFSRRHEKFIRKVDTSTGVSSILKPLEPLDENLSSLVCDLIRRRLSLNVIGKAQTKDLEGKSVVLDNNLMNMEVPKGMRDVISPLKGINLGISEEDNFIRLYTYWVQEDNKKEDLDLHCYFYNSRTKNGVNIGYGHSFVLNTNIGVIASHSGDVVNKPGKCAEYIDIDINNCVLMGYDKILMTLMNYKGNSFDTLDCHSGYETIESIENIIQDRPRNCSSWIPSDVKSNTVTPRSDSKSTALFLFDLKERVIKLIDYPMEGLPINHGHYDTEKNVIEYYSKSIIISAYDVLKVHFESRGAKVIDEDTRVRLEIEKDELLDTIVEKIYLEDMITDYTKILSVL